MIPEYRAERAFIGSKCESAYALRGYGVTGCEMGNGTSAEAQRRGEGIGDCGSAYALRSYGGIG